jgi:hypothetical protein
MGCVTSADYSLKVVNRTEHYCFVETPHLCGLAGEASLLQQSHITIDQTHHYRGVAKHFS